VLRSLWQYGNFILSSIRGELKGRFARSFLEGFWFILYPLAQSLIFSIVLAEVMHARIFNMDSSAAYPIYLLSGIAAWGLFCRNPQSQHDNFHRTVLGIEEDRLRAFLPAGHRLRQCDHRSPSGDRRYLPVFRPFSRHCVDLCADRYRAHLGARLGPRRIPRHPRGKTTL